MSEEKEVVKEVSNKTVDRKSFQKLIESAKKMDFESDHIYIPCFELGDNQRLKIHAMKMDDHANMRAFSLANESCQLWVAVLMFSAKDEDGEYVFATMDGYNFILSMGVKWYKRFAITAMEMSGYYEEFVAEKK
tara:strand:- start:6482 stop:6883 length:402 start_codon:yes stop_codon:yes gene_type:complete